MEKCLPYKKKKNTKRIRNNCIDIANRLFVGPIINGASTPMMLI